VKYTSRVYTTEIATGQERADFDAIMTGDWLYIREETVRAENGLPAAVIIPESLDRLDDFMVLRTRMGGEPQQLDDSGILISEKLARENRVSAGGNIVITTSGGISRTVKVLGVFENYVQHFIYMSPGLYSELYGRTPLFNSVLAVTPDDAAFSESLIENSNVRAVIHTEHLRQTAWDSTDALRVVVIVLIALACALAFVVLFNLTNINITERIRELATIKVLGFYNGELAMYIYRENGLVTLIGIAIGLFCGIFLHGYILMAAEIEQLMFPRIILPMSYVFSAALSIVFAIFVNLVMNFKLARIDMVESLKNVE